ncbi:MAG: hypothetical protein GX175_06775 [Halanaerobiaceae bacterium]|nr:hypothetical protein [Halanaerobiaceae bacterium]
MGNINSQTVIGLVLLVVGLIIFLTNLDIISTDFTLFIIGGGLVAAYYFSGKGAGKRKASLITAGLLVLMIGVYDLADNYIAPELSSSLFFALLATAFLLLYFIHTFHYSRGNRWPLYIALCIYAFSLFIYLVEVVNFRLIEVYVEKYWPLVMIMAGLYLLGKGLKNARQGNKKDK